MWSGRSGKKTILPQSSAATRTASTMFHLKFWALPFWMCFFERPALLNVWMCRLLISTTSINQSLLILIDIRSLAAHLFILHDGRGGWNWNAEQGLLRQGYVGAPWRAQETNSQLFPSFEDLDLLGLGYKYSIPCRRWFLGFHDPDMLRRKELLRTSILAQTFCSAENSCSDL